MSDNQISSEPVVIIPDMVYEWLKSKRIGPDPRGPTPDNSLNWAYNYEEQKWVKHLNNKNQNSNYKFPT